MFDRTVVLASRPHDQHINANVTVHRAPTDESIRLLREMETAARERVVESIAVGNTTFQCVVHIERKFHDGSTRFCAVFSLNGKKMTADYVMPDYAPDRREWAVRLRDEIAKVIATEILLPALDQVKTNTMFAA